MIDKVSLAAERGTQGAHQIASSIPSRYRVGNCSLFCVRSASHIKWDTMTTRSSRDCQRQESNAVAYRKGAV